MVLPKTRKVFTMKISAI